MKFKTTTDIHEYFKVLEENDITLPGLYSPAETVIENKIRNIVYDGNKNNLEIDVKKVIDVIGLTKFTVFSEMEAAVEEYFSQFGIADKLEQCYSKLSLVGKRVEGEDLARLQKEFFQKTEYSWGTSVDMQKSIKFNFGTYEYFKGSDTYTNHSSAYELGNAVTFIVKHFFDVTLPNMSTWKAAEVGVWRDFGNGLLGKLYKNGTFEIKHKDIDLMARDIKNYYKKKLTHYFIYTA